MTRARFVATARREFLWQVAYYDGKEAGLGTRFTAAVEEATLRAVAFRLTGSRASKRT
jgi:toxin ParE1/3/4